VPGSTPLEQSDEGDHQDNQAEELLDAQRADDNRISPHEAHSDATDRPQRKRGE
jgi:hypothetical protein